MRITKILTLLLLLSLNAFAQNKGIFTTGQFSLYAQHDYGFINNVSWTYQTSGNYELQRAFFSDYSDAITIYSGSNLSYHDETAAMSGYCFYRVRSNGGSWINLTLNTIISDNTIDTRTEFVGDSMVYGTAASPLSSGFAWLFAYAKNWTVPAAGEIIGLPGNSITPEASPPTSLWIYSTGANKMVSKIPELNYLINDFGVNDGVTTPILSNATPDQYKAALSAWLDYSIFTAGWPSNRIVVMGPFNSPTNTTRLATFRDAAKSLCADRRIPFFSSMDWEIANSIVPGDNVHMNTAQHKQFSYTLADRIENPGIPLTYATMLSIVVSSPTSIIVTYNVPVIATNVGWTFKKNGSANNPTSVSGSGTTKLRFTVPTLANGDVVTYSYDQTTGDAASLVRNYSLEVPNATDQIVTNNIQSSFDSDATALFNAITGTGETLSDDEKSAYNQFIVSCKAQSLWTKIKGFWLLGTSLNKSKFNFKDPQDLDASYRLTQTGTVTFSSDGATGTNAANNFLSTNFNPASSGTYRDNLCLFASQLSSGTGTKSIMCSQTSNSTGAYTIIPGGSTMYVQFNQSGGLTTKNNPVSKGRYYISRQSSTGWKSYKYKQLMLDQTATSFASFSSNICILGGIYPTDQKASYAGIADGLSQSELSNLEDILYTFEATLNRY